jgi:hypothetical protein
MANPGPEQIIIGKDATVFFTHGGVRSSGASFGQVTRFGHINFLNTFLFNKYVFSFLSFTLRSHQFAIKPRGVGSLSRQYDFAPLSSDTSGTFGAGMNLPLPVHDPSVVETFVSSPVG